MTAPISLPLIDETDDWYSHGEGEALETRVEAIVKTLAIRLEGLARSVAYGRSATTEQGIRFVTYVNGAVKPEGGIARVIAVAGLSPDEQVKAFQKAAEDTFDVILAQKPVDADLLVWRSEPEASRVLTKDGLSVRVRTRLAWDKLRDAD